MSSNIDRVEEQMNDEYPICNLNELSHINADTVEQINVIVSQLSSSGRTMSLDELRNMVKNRSTHILVARDGGTIVGMLTLVIIQLTTGLKSRIEDVAVHTSLRRRGIGAQLTHKAVMIAREIGARYVDLTSEPARIAANELYCRTGFTRRNTNVWRYHID